VASKATERAQTKGERGAQAHKLACKALNLDEAPAGTAIAIFALRLCKPLMTSPPR
jgi:hypothetical protein